MGPASADMTECDSESLMDQDRNLTVRDLMRTRPKTLPGNATVGDLRRLFIDPRILDVLLVDDAAFVGVVDRDDVHGLPDDTPAHELAYSAGVTIRPDAKLTDAMARLEQDGAWRLVVVGPDGVALEGLLCLNAKRTGFCR